EDRRRPARRRAGRPTGRGSLSGRRTGRSAGMLKIENLEAGYGKVKVLHGISLDVPAGKVVTLIGSNGAGKTTTMRAVSGMLRPSAGTIVLGDRQIQGLESHRTARLRPAPSPEGPRA